MNVLTSRHPLYRNGAGKPGTSSPPVAPPTQITPAHSAPVPRAVVGFHGAVCEFKRRLIEATLAQCGGNRTRTAKALGLQRTYLLRLMREFEIRIPTGAPAPRSSATNGDANREAPAPQTR